ARARCRASPTGSPASRTRRCSPRCELGPGRAAGSRRRAAARAAAPAARLRRGAGASCVPVLPRAALRSSVVPGELLERERRARAVGDLPVLLLVEAARVLDEVVVDRAALPTLGQTRVLLDVGHDAVARLDQVGHAHAAAVAGV